MQHKIGIALSLILLLFIVTGCAVTDTAFAKTASNAGAAFAAASTTLSYAHEGKITYAYAASSFANFQSELSGTDTTLAAQGANKRTVQHLLALYMPAMNAINAPCLSNTCNWQSQVAILTRASQAFLGAGNS